MPQLFRIIFLQIIGSKIQKLRKAAHRGDHVIILYCQTYLIHMSKYTGANKENQIYT
jgi:hypothetical protein